METLACSRCGSGRDLIDNFCRNCGCQLTVQVPVVRTPELPAIKPRARGIPPTLVGSVAALAVGTGLEWLARRAAGTAARSAGRALMRQERSPERKRGKQEPETATIDEVLYIRKVQLRR